MDRRQKDHKRKAPWWHESARMEVVRYETRDDALHAELTAIRTEHPLWNIMGRPHDTTAHDTAPHPSLAFRGDRE